MKTVLRISWIRTTLVAAIGALVMILAPMARAQDAAPPSPTSPPPTVANPGSTSAPAAPGMKGLSVWGIIPWGGYGAGARFMLPLAIPSLLANRGTSLHDTWDLEFGADILHWSYDFNVPNGQSFHYGWTEVLPVIGAMWNLWFTQNFALYPKLELGYAFGWLSNFNTGVGASPAYGGFFVAGDVGVLYKLDNGLTLRAEAGSDGLKLGAGWLF